MNIQTNKVQKQYEVEETIITYDVKDIKDMLIKDLNEKGYNNVEQIVFKTDQKYISDEWGMNGHYVTFFDGVKVIIK